MDVLNALAEARAAGLTLAVDGDKLHIRGPRQAKPIADKLGANKLAVIAELRRQATVNVVWQPSLLLTRYDWDSPFGYSPGRRSIRNGVEHLLETCAGLRFWRHVWGERYCSDCWPCTDPLAMVNDERENPKAAE